MNPTFLPDVPIAPAVDWSCVTISIPTGCPHPLAMLAALYFLLPGFVAYIHTLSISSLQGLLSPSD